MSLSVTPYTVQMIYGLYYQEKLKINRRYQRKLVWSINEKQSFIDSLIKGYPIPLILASKSSDENFEILDGLQRLNAIVSFIEGDFSVDGQYFDFNAITYTKTLIDEKKQKTPILGLSASLCSTCTKQKLKIGRYTAFPMLAMLISPSPHNLTVAILRFYHNPIFL